jgi:hypothetical protein
LYAGEICSVYRACHRINCRNEKSTARNNKPIIEDKFKDDKDDCHNKESTARNNKPIVEDKFEDDKDDCRMINVSFLEGIGFRFWGNSVGIPSVSFALTVSQMITVNENDPILQKKNAHAIPIQSLHSWYSLFERQQCFCWRN